MTTILFVCTGNACRSPMAAALLDHLAQERGVELRAASAGLSGGGKPAEPNAARAALEWGVVLSGHVSRPLSKELVHQADVVLTMTADQKQTVESRFPEATEKVGTLLERVSIQGDIEDPWHSSQGVYDACARQIRGAIEKLVCQLSASGSAL